MAAERGIEPDEGVEETRMAHVWLRPDGIMCVVLEPGVRASVRPFTDPAHALGWLREGAR